MLPDSHAVSRPSSGSPFRVGRLALLLLAAAVVRIPFLGFETADAHFWVVPWYDNLVTHGYEALGREAPNLDGFRDPLGGYPPTYHYLIYVSTFFEGLLPRLYLVKLISVAFDGLAAIVMFALVRRVTGSDSRGWVGAACVLLAPTVVANGAVWAQCDAIHSSLLLTTVYFSIVGNPLLAAAVFGVAFSFKAQSVLLLPYLLLLILIGRMRWWHLGVVPVVYAVMMLPAVLLGRPVVDVLVVYLKQGQFFSKLSMNSPNFYYFIPDGHYATGLLLGTAATVVASLAFAIVARRSPLTRDPRFLVFAATVSLAMSAFLLPKMHDRYFFPADIASIALALCMPRLWFVPIVFQISSGLSYVPALSDAWNDFHYEYVALMPWAAAINTAFVPWLMGLYWRCVRRGSLPGAPTSVSS